MADIILDHIFHKERSKVDTYDGKNEVEPVVGFEIEPRGKHLFYPTDEAMQQQGGQSGEHAHHETQDDHELPGGEMFFPPLYQLLQP